MNKALGTMFRAKTQQFIALIFKLYKHCTVQNLLKLAYLSDYLYFEKTGSQLSGFTYKLYSFGPFDESVFYHLEELIAKQLIRSHLNYTRNGLEYVSYVFNDSVTDLKFKAEFMPLFSILEFYTFREILYEFFYYNEKDLTEMVYKSKQVRALRITAPGQPYGPGRLLQFK
jgi:hypothetical protein